jgi:hypothetical protein
MSKDLSLIHPAEGEFNIYLATVDSPELRTNPKQEND